MNLANGRESRMMESECLASASPRMAQGHSLAAAHRRHADASVMMHSPCDRNNNLPFSPYIASWGSLTLFLTLCGAAIFGHTVISPAAIPASYPDSSSP